jgi:hypothetical protein
MPPGETGQSSRVEERRGGGRRHSVSSPLSKIPYGGFSPVRLQIELSSHHLRRRFTTTYRWPAVRRCAPVSRKESSRAIWRGVCSNLSIQRPLARQQVVVSRQVIAYYGLIRGSGRRSAGLLFFVRQPLGRPEIPSFKLPVLSSVPSTLPRRIRWWLAVQMPPVLPSPLSEWLGIRSCQLIGSR